MSFSHRRCIFPRGVEWHNSLEHTSIYLPLSASVCLCLPLCYFPFVCLSTTLLLYYSASVCLCSTLPLSTSLLLGLFCLFPTYSACLPPCYSVSLLLCYSASVCLSATLPLSASLLLCLCLPLFAVNVHLPYITDYTHLPCCLYCCTCSMKCNIEQNNWKKGLLHAPSRKRGEFNPLNSKHFFTGLFVLICEPKH